MPLPRSGRGGAGAPAANPQPTPCPSSAVHFDVPVAGWREVISVDCHGERTVRGLYEPVIFVALGSDGMYSAESVRGRFGSIDELMRAFFGASPCTVGTPSEEEQHVGSSASAQTPHPDGLQHLAFSGLPCKEQHAAEPASAQTLHKLDFLSLKDPRYPMAMEVSSTTAASLPSPHHTIEASQPSGRSLSSSPIWKQCNFDWEMTFYTIQDLRGYFHIFPHVGGPFQSKDEANKVIDRYLADLEDPTLGMGLSEADKLIQFCCYFPDGTKRRLKAGQPIDKRREKNYQLAQAVVYKYNDHHNLFGDLAYEVKDVLDKSSVWEEENYKTYIHMNFTAKTKVSDGFDTGSDNMFFAEVTYVTGKSAESRVNCCCIVKPFDNGPCLGCGTSVKHPKDGNAYTGGHMHATYSLPFGPTSSLYEDSDEEVERLRFLFGGAKATAGVPLKA